MGITITFFAEAPGDTKPVKVIQELASRERCRTEIEKSKITVIFCPTGFMTISLKRAKKKWIVSGICNTTPTGAGFHKAAVEFIDHMQNKGFVIQEVRDQTEYYRDRDFTRLQEEQFYPWLRNSKAVFAEMVRHSPGGIYFCWAPEQYEPSQIPDTVVSHMGRFTMEEFHRQTVDWLANRFFVWENAEKDALFYRNSALNQLWECCRYLPSTASPDIAKSNKEILDALETASQLDPTLPLPLSVYREVCALDERNPVLSDTVPEMTYTFPIGYCRQDVTHTISTLRLTLPGTYSHTWDDQGGYKCHLFQTPQIDTPVWRVSAFGSTKSKMDLSEYLQFIGLHDYEKCTLPNGHAVWGWMQEQEQGQNFFSIVGTLTTGSYVYLICVIYFSEADRIGIYEKMRNLSLLNDR